MKASQAHLAEIELGRLAQGKEQKGDVTGLARMIVDDHVEGLQKLTDDVFPYDTFQSTFSPGGDRMAFASDRRYNDLCCTDLFLMRADGSHQSLVQTGQFGVEE